MEFTRTPYSPSRRDPLGLFATICTRSPSGSTDNTSHEDSSFAEEMSMTWCRGERLGFEVWGLGFGVWDLVFGVWDLGFEVGVGAWDLGLGVGGLTCGVWGVGLR